MKELTDTFESLKAERTKVQESIESAMSDPESKAKLQTARAELKQLKDQKTAILDQKKALRAQLDQARNQTDKIAKDKKDVRSNIKFNSLQEIEAEIAKLQKKQETTTMTLNEEKKLIKEMEALQASKRFVADLKNKDAAMEGVKEQRKTIAEQISAKDKEMDELNKKMDVVMATIKEVNDKDSKKRDSLQGLMKKRDAFRDQITATLKERDALRDAFREKSNAYYNFQRGIRAQKKMAYDEEKKKRDEERAAHLAKLEEEEAKKIPYEEEQALCDYLADYLERTYLSGKSEENGDGKKQDVVAVKEDPFAGFQPVSKKVEDDYFSKGKSKKKRVRSAKNTGGGPFTLSVDTFEQFGLLMLSPPTSVEQVENSIKELREKKEWYKQQPRGTVPTANEIRKASEKAALKVKNSNGETPAPKPKPGGFSLSSDDFVPLGVGGTSSSANASWGKTPAAAAAAAASPEVQTAQEAN